tara:strand:+ start:728 stop:1591 length:864 start_codon:yes stop_codon:yes gene_type:complete
MSLNFSLLDGTDESNTLSGRFDYAELVEDVDKDIGRLPITTIILNKLRDNYFFKREHVHQIIQTDFLDFNSHRDEISRYLDENNIFIDDNIVGQIDRLYDERVTLTPEYVNFNNSEDSIIRDIITRIEDDTGVDFDATIVGLNKLRDYQRKLAKKYLELKRQIEDSLETINKRVKMLEAINDTFEFETDDKVLVADIVDKYIKRHNLVDLIKEYIPIKMKLYTMLGINKFAGLRHIACGECRICFEDTSELYAIPECGHTFCKTCINSIRRCALCRVRINKTVRIYL